MFFRFYRVNVIIGKDNSASNVTLIIKVTSAHAHEVNITLTYPTSIMNYRYVVGDLTHPSCSPSLSSFDNNRFGYSTIRCKVRKIRRNSQVKLLRHCKSI